MGSLKVEMPKVELCIGILEGLISGKFVGHGSRVVFRGLAVVVRVERAGNAGRK